MVEKTFQLQFGKWIHKNWNQSAAFELKISKTNSIPWNRLEPHQERALKLTRTNKLFHKISDASYETKPCDCFCLSGVPAYMVVYFYTQRGKKEFIMIDILEWIKFRDQKLLLDKKGSKSITEAEAKLIGETQFLL